MYATNNVHLRDVLSIAYLNAIFYSHVLMRFIYGAATSFTYIELRTLKEWYAKWEFYFSWNGNKFKINIKNYSQGKKK